MMIKTISKLANDYISEKQLKRVNIRRNKYVKTELFVIQETNLTNQQVLFSQTAEKINL